MPLLPLPESLGAQTRVFQEGTDDRQLGLFGLGGQKHMEELPHGILTHVLFHESRVCADLQSAAEHSDPVQPVVE